MATYSYIRISTDKQDAQNQKHGVLQFCNDRGLGKVKFIEEVVSGKVRVRDRAALAGLIDQLSAGDVLVVPELSRLGRSMLDVMSQLQVLLEKKVTVYAVKGGFELNDNITSKVLAFALSIAAEIERELISSRTRESLARKKAEGVKLGRPVGSTSASKLDGKEEQIKELLKHGVAKSAIARILECSRGTLIDFIKSRGLDTAAPRGAGKKKKGDKK